MHAGFGDPALPAFLRSQEQLGWIFRLCSSSLSSRTLIEGLLCAKSRPGCMAWADPGVLGGAVQQAVAPAWGSVLAP